MPVHVFHLNSVRAGPAQLIASISRKEAVKIQHYNYNDNSRILTYLVTYLLTNLLHGAGNYLKS
jgi:hypothetical protein